MVAQRAYAGDAGGGSLMHALDNSVARMKLTKDNKVTVWRVPEIEVTAEPLAAESVWYSPSMRVALP